MAAGALGVRKCSRSVACGVILEGEKITKSPAELLATYDAKDPIKGRMRRQRNQEVVDDSPLWVGRAKPLPGNIRLRALDNLPAQIGSTAWAPWATVAVHFSPD